MSKQINILQHIVSGDLLKHIKWLQKLHGDIHVNNHEKHMEGFWIGFTGSGLYHHHNIG